MAAKSVTTKKIPDVSKPARPGRVTTPKAPRVKAARHVKASIESPLQPEDPHAVIARIAYGFWEARGNEGGNALEDWLRAEQTYRDEAAC